MENTKFFSELLKLGEDWQIKNIVRDEANLQITIEVGYSKVAYSYDGNVCKLYDLAPKRRWQHLGIMQYRTYIECATPRFVDVNGKVKTVPVPWAESHDSYTYLFALYVINVLQAVRVQSKTALLCKTTDTIVRSIMEQAVEYGLTSRGHVTDLKHISIDEKAFKQGHQYATILMDGEQDRVLEMTEGRKQEQAEMILYQVTGKEVNETIETVTLDMWKPFMNAMEKSAPNAVQIHDKFHIFQYLSKSIDRTRKAEIKHHEVLKGMKYTVLKNRNSMTEKQQLDFEAINAINLKTALAWKVRENFKLLYEATTYEAIIKAFAEWFHNAASTCIPQVIDTLKTFRNNLDGIINSFLYKRSNAKHERMNGSIQTLINTSRGFRNFERFRINALFHYGKLTLFPLKFS